MAFIGDNELVHYMVTKDLGLAGLPERVRIRFERLEMLLAHDPALKARFEALHERLHMLPLPSDALFQFEQLTGHRLPPALN